MKKVKIILNLLAVFFLGTFDIKAAEQKISKELITKELYPIPLEIIKTGDVEAVKKALNDGADINAKYVNGPFKGLTALMAAIFKSTEEIVRLLIEKGADINAKNEADGNTALYIAVIDNNVSLVKLLLDNNANVNSALSSGTTPLMHIATGGSLEILRMLLDHGAKIDLKDKLGNTALMEAAKSLNPYAVKILLNAGANIYIKDNDDKDFLSLIESHYAYIKIREVYKEFLLSSYPIPLEIIKKDDIKAAQEALNKGADINAKYTSPVFYMGSSALNVAICYNNITMFEFLLKNNASLNSRTRYGYTPLMLACGNNNAQIIKTLIENNVDVNIQDNFGRTALIHIVKSSKGNIQNQISNVKSLLKAGADVYIADEEGKAFIDYIHKPNDLFPEERRKQILKTYQEFLEEKPLKILQLNIAENNNKKVIEFISEFPQFLNSKNEMGETILSEAILFGRFEIIKEIFENPNIKIKPTLLGGRVSKYLFDETNSVEYAIKLGRPGCDPAKKIYRDIAEYLRKQRNIQEAQENKKNN